MSRDAFIADIASRLDVTKREAERICKHVSDALIEGFACKGSVNVPGIGKFARGVRPETKFRHPCTGKTIVLPARNYVDFLPTKAFKDRVL